MNRTLCRVTICAAVALGGIGTVGIAGPASAQTANPAVHTLTLKNGWTTENGVFATGNPGVTADGNGVVHLSGSLGGGTSNTEAFKLPAGDAPASDLYIDTYTYQGTVGFLLITPSGTVFPDGSEVSNFTDLSGISFPSAGSSLTNVHPAL